MHVYIHTINRGVYSILISHCLSGCKKGKGESWLISTIAANWHFATTFNYITQELAKDSHLRRTHTHRETVTETSDRESLSHRWWQQPFLRERSMKSAWELNWIELKLCFQPLSGCFQPASAAKRRVRRLQRSPSRSPSRFPPSTGTSTSSSHSPLHHCQVLGYLLTFSSVNKLETL